PDLEEATTAIRFRQSGKSGLLGRREIERGHRADFIVRIDDLEVDSHIASLRQGDRRKAPRVRHIEGKLSIAAVVNQRRLAVRPIGEAYAVRGDCQARAEK